MNPTVLTQHIEISQLGRPIIELAKQMQWIKTPATTVEVPKPEASALPPEALDSVAPPAPSTPPDGGDPEVVVGTTDTGGMDVELDEMLANDSKNDEEHPSLTDDDSEESTQVISAADVERSGGKKNKDKRGGPPPLQKR
jgi:hypothetical protein